jgi:hypothetical protein
MQDNDVQGSPKASRRLLLKACAVTVGAGLIGAGGAGIIFAADRGDAGADGAPPPLGIVPSQRSLSAADLGSTSYNGWTVGTPGSVIGVQSYTVPGTSVVLQIRSGDVATVLLYVARRFNAEVEGLLRGQCGGYEYRANVNNPSVWSNHASGTAIDLNWERHPNGSPNTFSAAQTAAVRAILAFCGQVVYWGQDYRGVVDGMHFEINVPPGDARLTALVRKINSGVTAEPSFLPGIDSYLDSSGARHIFGATRSGQLRELTNRTGTWQNLDATSAGYIVGAPAVTYSGGRCDVHVIGSDGVAYTQFRQDGSGWSGWRSMGGNSLVGGLRAMIDDGGTHRVFAVNTVGGLYQYIGSFERGWLIQNASNGGLLRGTPAIVYAGGRYDVFGIGFDGAVWQQTYFEGSPGWNPWQPVGGTGLIGGLDAIRHPDFGFRVVGVDSSSRFQQFRSTDGTGWTNRDISNGGLAIGTPAVMPNAGRLDVMGVGLDGQVWLESLPPGSSTTSNGWAPAGGNFSL